MDPKIQESAVWKQTDYLTNWRPMHSRTFTPHCEAVLFPRVFLRLG
jgi:hypothetical protein